MGIVGGTLCGCVVGGTVGGSAAYGFQRASQSAAFRAEDPLICNAAVKGATRCGAFGGSAAGATIGTLDAIYHKYVASVDNARCKE